MKVVIIKKIGRFNQEGSTVEVKDGYARNFLIPNGFAFEATADNFRKLEEIKKGKAKLQERQKKTFLALKEKLDKISVTIAAEIKNDDEIYGTINEAQILKALEEEGIELEKGKIALDESIRKIGVYNLKVNLHDEVQAKFRLWVVKK